MSIKLKVFLIITLVLQTFTLFFSVVPLGHMWTYAMILPLINIVFYFIIFILMIREGQNLYGVLLLLFIPVTIYSAIVVSTTGDIYYMIASIVTNLYVSFLSVMILIKSLEYYHYIYKPIRLYPLIMLGISLTLTIIGEKIFILYFSIAHSEFNNSSKYLFFVPLFIYLSILAIYSIFAFLSTKKIKRIEMEYNKNI